MLAADGAPHNSKVNLSQPRSARLTDITSYLPKHYNPSVSWSADFNAETQKEELVKTAQQAAQKLIDEAEKQKVNLVNKAGSNVLKKLAAEKAGDILITEAKEQGAKLVAEAEKKGDELIRKAKGE